MNEHHVADLQTGGHFRIWIVGRLGEGFAAGIGEDIEQHTMEGETLLTGPFADQSQVNGILDHLRRLGIEVVRFDTPPSGGR